MADNSLYETLKGWILEHPGVAQAPHRFGGTEFQVGGVEFMHSHGFSFLDIRLSKEDQAQVLKSKKAIPHRFAPQAGWVSFRLEKSEDLDHAKKIIQLAYERANKAVHEIESRRAQTKLS